MSSETDYTYNGKQRFRAHQLLVDAVLKWLPSSAALALAVSSMVLRIDFVTSFCRSCFGSFNFLGFFGAKRQTIQTYRNCFVWFSAFFRHAVIPLLIRLFPLWTDRCLALAGSLAFTLSFPWAITQPLIGHRWSVNLQLVVHSSANPFGSKRLTQCWPMRWNLCTDQQMMWQKGLKVWDPLIIKYQAMLKNLIQLSKINKKFHINFKILLKSCSKILSSIRFPRIT